VDKHLQIAVDGPASSGKGTVARRVAKALNFVYIDTGAMYRGVAWKAKTLGIPLEDGVRIGEAIETMEFHFDWNGDTLRISLDGEDITDQIRTESVGSDASDIAVHPPVRQALLQRQRHLASAGGVVMDGRDIGSVVLPDAKLKIFLDASVETRADRRFKEMQERGIKTSYSQVLAAVKDRDRQDQEREVAPLVRDRDAVYIDTTGLTIEQAVQQILKNANELS
jgi:cytidylate kinase